jgi:hypothetical protein
MQNVLQRIEAGESLRLRQPGPVQTESNVLRFAGHESNRWITSLKSNAPGWRKPA